MKWVKSRADKDFPGMARLPLAAYQLKITLRDIDPPIWRRVVVPSDIRLGKLHGVFQDVMGWTNSHPCQRLGPNGTSVMENDA